MTHLAPPTDTSSPKGLRVALLNRQPYSARDPAQMHALGIALERQQGVHAIGCDRREDFDAWPGTVAYTPPGVDVFSESETGGEYLVARWDCGVELGRRQGAGHRVYWTGHAQALLAAQQLRRLLLDPAPDALAIEQAALDFVGLMGLRDQGDSGAPVSGASHTDRELRRVYGRVLERIACDLAQPLTIAQLAHAEEKTPLRFLREFTRLVGTTPHAFIVETRVQAARAMMQRGNEPLALVAIDCGFTHQSHMGAAFRKVLGQTPGRFLSARRARTR